MSLELSAAGDEARCRLAGWRAAGLLAELDSVPGSVTLVLRRESVATVQVVVTADGVATTLSRVTREPYAARSQPDDTAGFGRLLDGLAALLRPPPDEDRETKRKKRDRKRAAKAFWASAPGREA